jgi:hypothetical protein
MGTDLRNLNSLYGEPALYMIPKYVEESALLLNQGYLNTVDFGFKCGDHWRLRLRYTAAIGGQLRDDPPGRLPATREVAGFGFYSYLTYSAKLDALTEAQRIAFKASLPIQRTGASEPTIAGGSYAGGWQYSRNGQGVTRDVYSAF